MNKEEKLIKIFEMILNRIQDVPKKQVDEAYDDVRHKIFMYDLFKEAEE